jgi:VWFA-related protein
LLLVPRYLIAVTLAALAAAQPTPPVFRAGTRLVEVSVSVLDNKGNPVTGLGPASFTVLDGNKSRPIAFFRFEGGAQPAPAVRQLPPGIATNRVEITGGPPRNVTALVLDSLNTAPQDSVAVRAQCMRYLKAIGPDTRIAVFHMGTRLTALQDFTDDASALRAKIEKAAVGMPPENVTDFTRSVIEAEQFVDMFAGDPAMQAAMEEMMRHSLEVEGMANAEVRRRRMEESLAELEALGRHLAGIPGRKNLVWVGAGFSMLSITGAMGMGPRGSVENFEDKVRHTAQRLAQQGVILYIVDARGLQLAPDASAQYQRPLPARGRGRFEPQADAETVSNDPTTAMNLLAAVTGGHHLHNSNDLTAGLKQVISDLAGTYTLGFYVPDEPDNKWHKLKVRVNRPGVNISHREGYLADAVAAKPEEWSGERWSAAFADPIGSSAIPVTAKCEITPTGEVALTMVIDVNRINFRPEGDALTAAVQVAMADRTPQGRTRPRVFNVNASMPSAKWQEVSAKGLVYRSQWKPEPGATSVRIVVRDMRSGDYGSLDVQPAKPAETAH